MNRAARRAAARAQKRSATLPRHHIDPVANFRRIVNSAPHYNGEQTVEHIKLRECFDRLRTGTSDTDDFDHVAMTMNMCKVRAISIDAALADMLEHAQDAMGRCRERYNHMGRFGFDGPGLQDVLCALDACEAIIDASTPMQMSRARDIVADQLFGRGTAARLKHHEKLVHSGKARSIRPPNITGAA